jgi:DNA-binding HxlR family transcriptional regulator
VSVHATPGTRSYREYCAIARSLDLLGQRWTLLIVRDLFLGPQRYSDLLEGLPGIATDILTARLRTLEAAGLVRRRELDPPAHTTVYELTDSGWRLGPLIRALGEVGLTLLGTPAPDQPVGAGPAVMSLMVSFRADEFPNLAETYGLEVDGKPFTVTVDGGTARSERGAQADVSATFTTDARTLVALLRGNATPSEAVAGGRISVSGDAGALERFVAAFRHD